jgi:hypothetical protein
MRMLSAARHSSRLAMELTLFSSAWQRRRKRATLAAFGLKGSWKARYDHKLSIEELRCQTRDFGIGDEIVESHLLGIYTKQVAVGVCFFRKSV